MTVQQILDTRQLDSDLPTAVLEEAKAKVDQLVWHFERTEKWGAAGQAVLTDYKDLQQRLQNALEKRRGLDGMTPLTS